ncbi:hypothetical protein FOZ62_021594 [Perkinsus olseni]|uniref:Protein arginine methyltransferase 10 n=1 Tax=Perkinsus olseni TaxID=32597 RepID=A0A7J6TGU3_PEROL|nr:hypothetical protein FOZ62_021594 [Perkinsus olseni]
MASKVVVFPLVFERTTVTDIRLTAPSDFQFASDFFIVTVNGSTRPMPRSDFLVLGDASQLYLHEDEYIEGEQYGFLCMIKFPDFVSASGGNVFYLETSISVNSLNRRHFGQVVEAPLVRVITSLRLSFTTSVIAKVNTISLFFVLSSPISSGTQAGLVIEAPNGFKLAAACVPRGMLAQLDCRISYLINEEEDVEVGPPAARLSLGIRPATSVIPAGPNNIVLDFINPPDIFQNTVTTTACGMAECWTLRSLLDTEASGSDWRNMAEKDAAVASFDTYDEIGSAAIIPNTIGRDDRPGFSNVVAFSFRMREAVTESADMAIRAPPGTVFQQDCLPDVIIKLEEFIAPDGVGSMRKFEPGIEPTTCMSVDNSARMSLPGGLKAGVTYAFAVRVRNALEESEDDASWSIIYAGEGSAPIPAFRLWLVSDVSITPSQTVRFVPASLTQTTTGINYVTIDFKTYHPVKAGERIRILAPGDGTEDGSFEFFRSTFECDLTLRQIHDDSRGLTTSWGSNDFTCIVEEDAKYIANINIITTKKSIRSGVLYRAVAAIYNPQRVSDQAQAWRIETYGNTFSNYQQNPDFLNTEGALLDAGSAPGFPITQDFHRFIIEKERPDVEEYGGKEVGDVRFLVALRSALEPKDAIRLIAPSTFVLGAADSGDKACHAFAWDLSSRPPQSVVECDGNVMTWHLQDRYNCAIQPSGVCVSEMKFLVNVTNPSETPPPEANFWIVEHRLPNGVLEASRAVQGWQVIPSFQSATVDLTGRAISAGSRTMTEIVVSFVPTSTADLIELTVLHPGKFDLSPALPSSVGHVVLEATTSTVKVQGAFLASSGGDPTGEHRVSIRLRDIVLGYPGGLTRWELRTFYTGDLQDSITVNGFSLPGRLEVIDKSLSTEQDRNHHAGGAHPFPSTLPITGGEMAVVRLTFSLTMPLFGGGHFVIHAPGYTLLASSTSSLLNQSINISSVSGPQLKTRVLDVSNASAGEQEPPPVILELLPGEAIHTNEAYVISMDVACPYDAGKGDNWLLETWTHEPQYSVTRHPSNSNDGEMTSFVMAFDYHLSVWAARAAPSAEATVTLVVNLRMSSTRELLLTAPEGFAFPRDCLVATITTLEEELEEIDPSTGMPGVTSPEALSEPAPHWLIQGLALRGNTDDEDVVGWGVDFAGFNITPMSLARFHYPRVAQASTTLGVEFATTQRLSGGGMIRVNLPPSASATCVSFIGLSLANAGNGRVICEIPQDSNSAVIYLNTTLLPGTYSFALGLLLMNSISPAEEFSLYLLSRQGAVVDAAVQIPAVSVVRGLIVSPEAVALSADGIALLPESVLLLDEAGVEAPANESPFDAATGKPEPGRIVQVTLALDIQAQVPADLAISRVLITCPKGFRHLITTDSALSTQVPIGPVFAYWPSPPVTLPDSA